MPEGEEVRIEIGFVGGGGVNVSADGAQGDQLEAALDSGQGGWVTLVGKDDVRYRVHLDKVVFVRSQTVSRSIGFANI